MQTIKVYSTIKNARLEFVLHFVFVEVLKHDWQFVENALEADVIYGDNIEGKCSFQASTMMGVGRFPKAITFKEGKLFFNAESYFDPFSAIFYCLSRMEELNAPLDGHDRFSGDTSVFNGRWETPWVDVWVDALKRELGINTKLSSNFLLTVDLDFGYRYLGKGFLRSSAAFIREVLTLRWDSAKERLLSIVQQRDPYDGTYGWLTQEFQKSNLRFFALSANFGRYDKGLKPDSNAWKRLKNQLSDFPVGLHPSYDHIEKQNRLLEGKEQLQKHGFEIEANRFHFLRFRTNKDFQRLIDVGILNDYSMGFANRIGFRAQTSHSFHFYDLHKEEQTALKLHPFVCMDAVVCNYQSLSVKEMKQKVLAINKTVQELGGTLCLLWHDHTLLEGTETRALLEEMLPQLKS
jgi:hypothetical protein